MKRLPMCHMINKKTKCHFSLRQRLPKTLRLFLRCGVARKEIGMSTTLGLYGLKAEIVCEKFNEESRSKYRLGITLPTLIFINQSKEFFLEFEDPSVFQVSDRIWNFRRFVGYQRRFEQSSQRKYQEYYFPLGEEVDGFFLSWVGDYWPTWFTFMFPNFAKKNKWFSFLYNLIIYTDCLKNSFNNEDDDFDNNSDDDTIDKLLLEEEKQCNLDSFNNLLLDNNKGIDKKRKNNYFFSALLIDNNRFLTSYTEKFEKALDNYRITLFRRILGVQNSFNLERDYRYIPRPANTGRRGRSRNRKKHRGKIKR